MEDAVEEVLVLEGVVMMAAGGAVLVEVAVVDVAVGVAAGAALMTVSPGKRRKVECELTVWGRASC